MPENNETEPEKSIYQRLTAIFGISAVFISVLGLVSLYFDIHLYSLIYPGYKPMAFSSAIIWIFLVQSLRSTR